MDPRPSKLQLPRNCLTKTELLRSITNEPVPPQKEAARKRGRRRKQKEEQDRTGKQTKELDGGRKGFEKGAKT